MEAFGELPGTELKIKGFRAWAPICSLISQADGDLVVLWGDHSHEEIVELGAAYRDHKSRPASGTQRVSIATSRSPVQQEDGAMPAEQGPLTQPSELLPAEPERQVTEPNKSPDEGAQGSIPAESPSSVVTNLPPEEQPKGGGEAAWGAERLKLSHTLLVSREQGFEWELPERSDDSIVEIPKVSPLDFSEVGTARYGRRK